MIHSLYDYLFPYRLSISLQPFSYWYCRHYSREADSKLKFRWRLRMSDMMCFRAWVLTIFQTTSNGIALDQDPMKPREVRPYIFISTLSTDPPRHDGDHHRLCPIARQSSRPPLYHSVALNERQRAFGPPPPFAWQRATITWHKMRSDCSLFAHQHSCPFWLGRPHMDCF